uniref:AAA-type ATPase N-terminal domain-containing protein n=1 Tax=Ananas comosus var. bracteatus TaxID=296719 RepID=A0A6V7P3T9_ANACO|nr:unnamed protein product [Ananas comosus var. bracteatus]
MYGWKRNPNDLNRLHWFSKDVGKWVKAGSLLKLMVVELKTEFSFSLGFFCDTSSCLQQQDEGVLVDFVGVPAGRPGLRAEPPPRRLPAELRVAFATLLRRLSGAFSPYCYFEIPEIDGVNTNELYNAVHLYLSRAAAAAAASNGCGGGRRPRG